MSKQNKIVTNYPVNLTVDEVANLSATLAPVVAACGGGGGGGTPIYYYGDDVYTHIKENRTIVLTDTVTAKLAQDIPTMVTDLSDSANYLTTADAELTYQPKGDYLDRSIYETASANFATKAELENYQTKGDYLSGNALDNVSGTWNTVTQKLDTTAFSTVSGSFLTEVPAGYATETWVENKHYLSAVPDTYYTKSQTSGADQLAAAFGNILEYDVTAAAGIKITTATDDGTTTFGISMTAEPVVTDTTISGYNGVAAALDGNVSGQWNVGLTQDMLNVINGKEDILSFSYDGNTITAINTSAVGKEFDGVVTAGSLSGNGTTNSPLGIKTDAALNLINASAKSAASAVYANIAKGDHTDYNLGSTLDTMSNITALIDTTLMSVSGYNGIEKQIDGTTYYATAFGLTNSAYAAIQYVTANSGDWDNVSAKLDTTAAAQTYLDKTTYATDSATFVTSSSDTITGTKQYALTTAGWAEVSTPTIPAITAESGISADGYKIGLTTTAINAITSVSSKVDKPDITQAALNDKYLIYSTLSGEGQPTGWVDMQAKVYSKTEADGTFVATANIDTTTLSGDGKSVSTKLGVKTDVIATRDYVNSSFLPTSGGTVSGELIVSGGSNFDSQFLKITREGVNGYGRIGLGQSGPLALKVDDANSHTTQVNISPNNSNDQLIQVQHNNGNVGYLIPAVTATTTAGLTDDGILHIIVES